MVDVVNVHIKKDLNVIFNYILLESTDCCEQPSATCL